MEEEERLMERKKFLGKKMSGGGEKIKKRD